MYYLKCVLDDGMPPVEQSGDGFLNFTSIRRDHSGWYKCTTRHLLGDFSSIGYFVNVRCKYWPRMFVCLFEFNSFTLTSYQINEHKYLQQQRDVSMITSPSLVVTCILVAMRTVSLIHSIKCSLRTNLTTASEWHDNIHRPKSNSN